MMKDWHQQLSQPKYDIELEEDVWVTMRDGVRLSVDIYRPKAQGKFPALVSFSWFFGKDHQKMPTNPIWQRTDYIRGTGGHACGEQWYFVPRGYVQVIPDTRGVGKSEGSPGVGAQDGYDLIEWIAKQPWCDGNIGMIGMSGFGGSQVDIAAEQPPHLKAIFPFEGSGRDQYRDGAHRGGVLQHGFRAFSAISQLPRRVRHVPQPASFKEYSDEELRVKIRELQNDPDIQCTPNLYILTLCPEMAPGLFDQMLHPYDGPFYQRSSANSKVKNIKIPCYWGARWDGPEHIPATFYSYENVATPRDNKKLLLVHTGGIMDRPHHEVQDVCLRWYDHWLKGIDTGIMDEPPILLFISGINKWRYENEWPPSVTKWTKFYLRSNSRLSTDPPSKEEESQTFTNNPWARPSEGFREADWTVKADPIPKAIYETEPLSEDMEVTGPIALYWYASIESKAIRVRSWNGSPIDGLTVQEPITNDTNWYLKIKDIDMDGNERLIQKDLLKASHYELDKSKSKPYAPYHPHNRSLPIKPGEVILYANDLRVASNVFLAGHRIRLEISGQDYVNAAGYHLPHMAEVKHTIHSTGDRLSYLLLPVIPKGYSGDGEPTYLPAGPFRMQKHSAPR